MKGVSVSKRAGGLLLAVLLASLATTALISYVNGLEGKAFAGAETVEVYVAKDDILAGTPADVAVQRAAFTRTEIPRKVAAEGAIASLDQLRGRVAAVTIVKGEQIVLSRFVDPGDTGTGLAIPEGLQAMAVEVDTPPGVAGYVQAGSHVSVIAHLTVTERSASQSRAQFLLQDVAVLAVGRSFENVASGERDEAKAKQTTPSERVLLTLAVSPQQAEKLAFAIFEGEVYFTLLPPNQKPGSTPGRTSANVFGG